MHEDSYHEQIRIEPTTMTVTEAAPSVTLVLSGRCVRSCRCTWWSFRDREPRAGAAVRELKIADDHAVDQAPRTISADGVLA